MLPELFLARMKNLLPSAEYDRFVAEMTECPARHAVRVNTVKCSTADFCALSPFKTTPIPYARDGFYHEEEKIGAHPLHHAGALYSQDPGAMASVNCLPTCRGARVLDVCASPGGKSGQLAAAIGAGGLLVANEYVPSRCKMLVGNIERLGIRNALVLNTDSKTLAALYPHFFDIVLVDAPCSGEGMFRKSEEALADWCEETVKHCAERQAEILENAAKTVGPGGYLLYSTCTFSVEENEAQVAAFLEKHPSFSLSPAPPALVAHTAPGLSYGGHDLSFSRRFYPHISPGEGQYFALMKNNEEGEREKAPAYRDTSTAPDRATLAVLRAFFQDTFGREDMADWVRLSRNLLFLPPPVAIPEHSVFAAGVLVGEVRKGICFPHHQLFSAFGREFVRQIDLSLTDERLPRYLRGEEIEAGDTKNGYTAVTLEGCPLGGAKVSGGRAKNLYPKGLRLR